MGAENLAPHRDSIPGQFEVYRPILSTHTHTHTHTHNHSVGLVWTRKKTSMHSAGFEPAIPGSERPQTNALDRASTETGTCLLVKYKRDSKS